ncbi:hypothetical protein KW798_03400 [Candidatus Parcubacteria bacterium]|nr:hypothetical protein [Candidatus Parcubacteria bacterium]
MTEPTRITGTLESFERRKGISHGYVRLSNNTLVHVATANRGVLQEDAKIRPCINGERHGVIASGTIIALDVTYDRQGENPFPVLWAPKH